MDDQGVSIDATNSQPDEYARENGLSVDSKVDIFLLFTHFQKQTTEDLWDELIDDASLPPLQIPILRHRTEQLDIPKDSLGLLKIVASLGRGEDQAPKLPTSLDFAKLKLEPPLLRSDPEYDCRELVRCVQEQRSADVDLTSVPLEPLSNSNDEGLDFPETTQQYRQKLITAINDEKMDIPKETLYYLSRLLKDEWTKEKQDKLGEIPRRMPLRELAITPFLSPRTPDEGYFIPNEETFQIPISSDPSTLFDTDLSRTEADLLKEDDFHLDSLLREDFEHLFTPLEDLDLPILDREQPSISSLKVEGPLTPLNTSPPPSDLAVEISSLTTGMDIDQVLDKQQVDVFDADRDRESSGIFSDDVLTVLREKAASAKRSIEQEQLQTADAVARIEIPAMDFSIPGPDWQKVPLDAASQLAWIEKKCEAFNVPPWPKDSQAERELRWSPFPSKLGYISMSESIDSDDDATCLLNFSGPLEVSTSAAYVWKQPGLAILRDLDEEEELSESYSGEGIETSLESLVRKRRFEPSSADPEPRNLDSDSPIDLVRLSHSTTSVSPQVQLGGQSQLPSLLLSCNDTSATSTLLSNYVDFHTSKRQKHTKSSFFTSLTKPVAQIVADAIAKTTTTAQPGVLMPSTTRPEQKPATPAPCPKIESTSVPTKVIKALTLARGVFLRLEKSYPNAEIIERDFDRWNTLAWSRNSVARSPVVSPLAAEADVIVSPSTGIMLTTLLKVIQKPQPGHGGLSTVRERISNVVVKYERLIILVSEGNRIDETMRGLAPSECVAYADFTGFVAKLESNAQVYYVGGGDDTLAKWLVSFLIRYAPEAAAVQDILIQEESLWELFLRRAGMNAYAAQAILGQLKPPDDMPEEDGGKYGLPAFIRMTPEERVQAFWGLMGGERVLRRVNDVLETRWS